VTFLAIPIVVLEGRGPFASLKRSGVLLRATWGENVAAQADGDLADAFAPRAR
jgi:hypothetical protein